GGAVSTAPPTWTAPASGTGGTVRSTWQLATEPAGAQPAMSLTVSAGCINSSLGPHAINLLRSAGGESGSIPCRRSGRASLRRRKQQSIAARGQQDQTR